MEFVTTKAGIAGSSKRRVNRSSSIGTAKIGLENAVLKSKAYCKAMKSFRRRDAPIRIAEGKVEADSLDASTDQPKSGPRSPTSSRDTSLGRVSRKKGAQPSSPGFWSTTPDLRLNPNFLPAPPSEEDLSDSASSILSNYSSSSSTSPSRSSITASSPISTIYPQSSEFRHLCNAIKSTNPFTNPDPASNAPEPLHPFFALDSSAPEVMYPDTVQYIPCPYDDECKAKLVWSNVDEHFEYHIYARYADSVSGSSSSHSSPSSSNKGHLPVLEKSLLASSPRPAVAKKPAKEKKKSVSFDLPSTPPCPSPSQPDDPVIEKRSDHQGKSWDLHRRISFSPSTLSTLSQKQSNGTSASKRAPRHQRTSSAEPRLPSRYRTTKTRQSYAVAVPKVPLGVAELGTQGGKEAVGLRAARGVYVGDARAEVR